MTTYLFLRHKVRDFATWKVGYDGHATSRAEAGLTERYLLRSTDDANEVFALFEAKDLARARAFAESDDLRDKMQEVGVVDRPDLHFLRG